MHATPCMTSGSARHRRRAVVDVRSRGAIDMQRCVAASGGLAGGYAKNYEGGPKLAPRQSGPAEGPGARHLEARCVVPAERSARWFPSFGRRARRPRDSSRSCSSPCAASTIRSTPELGGYQFDRKRDADSKRVIRLTLTKRRDAARPAVPAHRNGRALGPNVVKKQKSQTLEDDRELVGDRVRIPRGNARWS
jgi:hypothetical protein